jgi:hypothetical protein
VDYHPINHANNHEKYRYGSTNRVMLMSKRLACTSVEASMKSFSKLIQPPWESIKESASGSLRILLDPGNRNILLNILGVSGMRFFPSKDTQIVLLFESNIQAHRETNSLKSKTSGMQPTITTPVI